MTPSSAPMQNPEPSGTITPFPRRKVAHASGAGVARDRKRTTELKSALPRGITIGHRSDGRDKPFFIRWGPDRRTESFESEGERNSRAVKLAETTKSEGRAVLDFDPAEWRLLQDFKARTGMTLPEVLEIAGRVRGNLRLNLTVAEAVPRFLDQRKAEGIPALSLMHPRLHLGRFATRCGYLPIVAVTADHIRGWLAALKAEGFGPVTVRHHWKNLTLFFKWAVREKLAVENPCSFLPPPRVGNPDTSILSAEDIFRLLKVNRDWPVVGRIVMELYGAMRCVSVERIEAAHLRMEARGIEMPGTRQAADGRIEVRHKSRARKYRQGHPPVLWAWLEYCMPQPQPEEGPLCFADITEKNYDERKKAAFVRAGWETIPHNRLRHSCASYLLAATKNPPLVGYLMQHTDLKMLERYEGVAEERDAKMVLSMTPEAVALGDDPTGKESPNVAKSWALFQQNWEQFYQPIPTNRS